MNLAFDHPAALLLFLLCVPPLLGAGARFIITPALLAVPNDPVSRALDMALRILAALPIACTALGLAGLHAPGRVVRQTGQGAHIAIVLDRSLSMDEPFALHGEKSQESKSEAATRMLQEFLARRPRDSFAVVAFSTSPIPVMPLTAHHAAIQAAIAAMRRHALANTDIGGGIAMGLAQFANDADEATRVLLLVSDGAGSIPEPTRDYIRARLAHQPVHLYYLYLRAGDDPPLFDQANGETDIDRPAGLAAFLQNLGVPYQGFEARDPQAVARAAARIDALETSPLPYIERTHRQDFAWLCYVVAAIGLALGLILELAERSLPELVE